MRFYLLCDNILQIGIKIQSKVQILRNVSSIKFSLFTDSKESRSKVSECWSKQPIFNTTKWPIFGPNLGSNDQPVSQRPLSTPVSFIKFYIRVKYVNSIRQYTINRLRKDHLQFEEWFYIDLLLPTGILEHRIRYHKRDFLNHNSFEKLHVGPVTT